MNPLTDHGDQSKYFKELLKSLFRKDGHLFGCTFSYSDSSVESDFCSCSEKRKRILRIINE